MQQLYRTIEIPYQERPLVLVRYVNARTTHTEAEHYFDACCTHSAEQLFNEDGMYM